MGALNSVSELPYHHDQHLSDFLTQALSGVASFFRSEPEAACNHKLRLNFAI